MKKILPLLFFAALPGAAFAHAGGGLDHSHGFMAGLLHPLTGMDHILAMVSVGLLAALMGSKARWLLPTAFMTMMAAGGMISVWGLSLPFSEILIALSVIVLGAMVFTGRSVPTAIAVAITGAFAVFHGSAHGLAMPAGSSIAAFGLGFVVTTGLLHLVGLGVGTLSVRSSPVVARIAGVAVTVAGLGILGAGLGT